jgi:hypothetical protein
MSEKIYTAEDIYTLIDNKSVTKDVGVKLIENYGYRQQREAIEKLQSEFGGYSVEIEDAIGKVNAQLDEMLKNTVNACTNREGL